MALARAFTSKRTKFSDASPLAPTRSSSARIQSRRAVRRSQISAPMELLSTTNMLSFNAPDIHSLPTLCSNSEDDSDTTQTAISSPPTSVEASPIDSRSVSPEPNHLSTYFQIDRPSSHSTSKRGSGRRTNEVPAVPQRPSSHTKAAQSILTRQDSQSRKLPPESMPPARDSAESRSTAHPFSKELEQLNEVAEGFGVREDVIAEEEELLREKGLMKFDVQDYLQEIEGLYEGIFGCHSPPLSSGWI